MTFSEPFTNSLMTHASGRRATAVAFAGAGLALVFNLVLALGILPAFERREREIPVELTSVEGGTAPLRLSAREVVVKVDASGALRLGGRDVDLATLEARLTNLVREGGETALTLRADARAPHGAVARIFAVARKAGIRDAAILTVDTADTPAPPE
jgi:biopolymer transport protein ExbD